MGLKHKKLGNKVWANRIANAKEVQRREIEALKARDTSSIPKPQKVEVDGKTYLDVTEIIVGN